MMFLVVSVDGIDAILEWILILGAWWEAFIACMRQLVVPSNIPPSHVKFNFL